MVLVEMVEPQVEVDTIPKRQKTDEVCYVTKKLNLQQTPNPAAQLPSALPPLDEHSVLV